MFKVKVLTQGKAKESWLISALSEYEKRLSGKMDIEWILVNKSKDLEEKAFKESNLIALDPHGKSLTSEEFSRALFSKWGARPCFVIGDAEGLQPSILAHAKHRLSLSPLTFTHQMVRLILVEQLYRAIEIEEGSSYHK
jgi:23S rRNA (pseudouridine1915-N3)-methyltransferase